MQTIFEKNFEVLCKYHGRVAAALEQYLPPTEEERTVFTDYSAKGEPILAVLREGHAFYLNSRYDAENNARVWGEQFGDTKLNAAVLIFGIGDGRHIRELVKNAAAASHYIVYEPCMEILYHTMQAVDISDILLNQKLYLSVKDKNEEELLLLLRASIDITNMKYTQVAPLPNYNRIEGEDCNRILQIAYAIIESLAMSRNTEIALAKEITENLLANIPYYIRESSIAKIKEALSDRKLNSIPAIVISAGPSLKKNIQELKKAKGRAFLIAVDTAVKVLLENEIVPDLFITLDSHKPAVIFANDKIPNIPMAACESSNILLFQKHRAKKFYFSNGNKFISYLYGLYGQEAKVLNTGGSVANNAFSLAVYLGFFTIILVGQDLAFTDGETFAGRPFGSWMPTVSEYEKNMGITWVEDIHGNMIQTIDNMKSYLRWFEHEIELRPSVRVIDATEGGARIHGTEILSLKESIERECLEEIDFEAILRDVPDTFQKEQKQALEQILSELPLKIEALRKRLEEGMAIYRQIIAESEKGIDVTSDKEILGRMSRFNKEIEHHPVMELVFPYAKKEDYEVLQEVYGYEATDGELVKMIAEKGIYVVQSYLEAIECLKRDIALYLK